MDDFDLRKFLTEGKLYEAVMACPIATQDLEVNTKNRDASIKADYIKYGPLNLSDEGYQLLADSVSYHPEKLPVQAYFDLKKLEDENKDL